MSDQHDLPAALAGPTRHLFVSPHYDDIALSGGGTAALLSRAGLTPEVAIVFGAEPAPNAPLTPFAADMHAKWGMDAAQVIAGRRREEAAASAILGTRVAFLPFHDAIYRGARYLNDPELFGETAADEADLPDRLIAALGLAGPPDLALRVYLPLAAGGHVDHRHAFRAGVTLARAGWDVWFYEDLPYGLRPGAIEERVATAEVPLTEAGIVPIGAVWAEKLAAVLAYPSQLAVIFGYVGSDGSPAEVERLMRAYATHIGAGIPAERYWRLAEV